MMSLPQENGSATVVLLERRQASLSLWSQSFRTAESNPRLFERLDRIHLHRSMASVRPKGCWQRRPKPRTVSPEELTGPHLTDMESFAIRRHLLVFRSDDLGAPAGSRPPESDGCS